MREYAFVQVDVFTDQPFGGNPLAVFHQAEGLTSTEMQQLAQEMNLSETTFVLPPEAPGADFRVRIFTPATELPFAGHPVIGTHWLLARLGRVTLQEPSTRVTFELNVGVRGAQVFVEGGDITKVLMDHQRPESQRRVQLRAEAGRVGPQRHLGDGVVRAGAEGRQDGGGAVSRSRGQHETVD